MGRASSLGRNFLGHCKRGRPDCLLESVYEALLVLPHSLQSPTSPPSIFPDRAASDKDSSQSESFNGVVPSLGRLLNVECSFTITSLKPQPAPAGPCSHIQLSNSGIFHQPTESPTLTFLQAEAFHTAAPLMGGSALGDACDGRRRTPEEYAEIKQRVLEVVTPLYEQVGVPRHIKEKEDFGDLDVVVKGVKNPQHIEIIKEQLNSKKVRGHL
jgi:hypothetical protein